MNDLYPTYGVYRFLKNIVLGVCYIPLSVIVLIVELLIPRKKFIDMLTKAREKADNNRMQMMAGHISAGDYVLDVGSGSGRFGEKVGRKFNVSVVGVDVVDYANATIPVSIYNGQTLPFPDNSFDTIFLVFVLHHCREHGAMINEIIRCARKKIIILEDTYFAPWERFFAIFNDFNANIFRGQIKIWKGYFKAGSIKMPMPCTFRSYSGWQKYFSRFPLKINDIRLTFSRWEPLTQVAFLLEKTATRTFNDVSA